MTELKEKKDWNNNNWRCQNLTLINGYSNYIKDYNIHKFEKKTKHYKPTRTNTLLDSILSKCKKTQIYFKFTYRMFSKIDHILGQKQESVNL